MLEAQQAQPAAITRVLVVDDSKIMRQAIKKMLNADFEVVLAEDGERGWQQLLQDNQIGALITDIAMPVLDGYALICRIRASEDARIRDLPVITITGADDDETKSRAYACGSTDFITKPIDGIQLKTRVRAYIKYDQTTRQLEEKAVALEDESVNDPLTQMRSRRYFLQRGEQDISHALRHKQDMSLLRLDIDDFKKIYKAHGDAAFDHLLIWFAKNLTKTVRADDTVARIAGSAFAVLAPMTTRADALQLSERLRVTIAAQPFVHGENEITVTASIGMASTLADHRPNMEQLLRLAEERLIHARGEGGNRVCASVLGDQSAEPEEVMLAAPPEPAPLALVPGFAAVFVESPNIPETLEAVEAEAIEAAPVSLETEAAALALVARDAEMAELVSIDKALHLLAQGGGGRLLPYIENLMLRLQPLLAFYRESQREKTKQTRNE